MVRTARRRTRVGDALVAMRYVQSQVTVLVLACVALGACGDGVGPCDPIAADELVYGRNGLVATKGQALAHDSCGNGAFCHAAAAHGSERYGAPSGMAFDMLPSPTGLVHVLDDVDALWIAVRDGDMPPIGRGDRVQGDGDWRFDVERRADAPRLPSIKTPEGQGMFRNWLACGAPVVADTQVPQWARPPYDPFAGDGAPAWHDIYEVILKPNCSTNGCHIPATSAGALAMPDECGTYAQMFEPGDCGEPLVLPGDAAASLLIDKLTAETPRCKGRMPTFGPLPRDFTDAIARWIDAGAEAEACAN